MSMRPGEAERAHDAVGELKCQGGRVVTDEGVGADNGARRR